MNTTSLILLAGGLGIRMASPTPKPFLPIEGEPMVMRSFTLFSSMKEIDEIVVVCPEEYRFLFPKKTRFASPGQERQDSVRNGFEKTTGDTLVIHDGARPFVDQKDVLKLLKEGTTVGAAALGAPVRNTIKQVSQGGAIEKTLDRKTLYEVYTPQLLWRTVYENGFAAARGTLFTDDVSLAELIDHPVKIVLGNPSNRKITYPSDL